MVLDFIQAYAARLATQLPYPTSHAEWQVRADEVSKRLRRSLGLDNLAACRHPSEAQVVGVLPRTGYTIEKVIYET